MLAAALVAGRGGAEEFLPPPPPPDRDFYMAKVAPWIEAHCADCHGAGGGALRLSPAAAGGDVARRRADFERLRPFVDTQAPWESRLLRKVLEPADGGDGHAGGAFLSTEDAAYDVLLDFVSGATLSNLPPEIWFEKSEIRAKPGETVEIDGRGSYDRDIEDMDDLAWYWELYARPAGSRVLIDDRRASRLTFEPDTGGSYVFRLRVGDGKVWSAPRAITVEVFQYVELAKSEPGGVTKLATTEPQLLRRLRRLYLDVLGRPPTPAEAVAEERRGLKDLVRNITLRAEGARAWVEEVALRFGLHGDHRPVGEEARALALRIPAESTPPHVVEATLAGDPSFLARHPPGRELADAIARLLLGRAPTATEVLAAADLAAGKSAHIPGVGAVADARAWLDGVLASDVFVRASLRRRLGRFLDSGDVDRRIERALGAVREGPKAWRAFLEDVLLSAGYLGRKRLRPKEPLTFFRSLYVDLLERKPTDRELSALVAAADAMPGESAALAAIVRVLIDSGEARIPLLVEIRDGPAWVTDRFLRYLGRRPRPAEMKACGEALLHPDGGPELVIHALLTGAEYMCR
jgi:hypothetical protein